MTRSIAMGVATKLKAELRAMAVYSSGMPVIRDRLGEGGIARLLLSPHQRSYEHRLA
jgi:hypothetical protein